MGMAELIIGIGKKPKMGKKPEITDDSTESDDTDAESDEAAVEAAGELLSAIKKNDAQGVVDAIKTIMHCCM